jgi:hypothetical protein
MLRLAPGYSRFEAFCVEAEINHELEDAQPSMCFEMNVVSDDKDGDLDDEREQGLDPREIPVEPVCASFDLNSP